MKNKKFTKIVLGLLITVFMTSPFIVSAGLPDRLNEINSEINENKAELGEIQQREKSLKSEIYSMDSSISSTSSSISQLNSQIKSTQGQITNLINEIKISEDNIAKSKENLKKLVQLLYEQQKTNTFELLASAGSVTDIVNAEEYNRSIEDKVNSTIAEVKRYKEELNAKRLEQENKKKEIETRKAEIVAQQNELMLQKSQRDELLRITQGDEAKYQQILKDLQSQREAVEAEIWRNNGGGGYVNLGDVSRGDIIGYQGNSGFSTGSHLHFEIRDSGNGAHNPASYVGNGYWAHPLSGARVTCGWYCYSGHRGIDYALSYGAPVRASADGIIIARVTGRGNTYPYLYDYGNYVKIKHDNGWYSLYAHLR